MQCPDCKSEIPESPGADVQICVACQKNAKRKRRVPKLQPEPGSLKLRIDSAHHGSPQTADKTHREHLSFVSGWMGTKPRTHMAVFGLLVFLIGQAIHVWAFLAGNYFAWTTANLITVVGITISIVAIVVTMRNFENRLESMARNSVRSKTTQRPRHTKKRKSVEKS